MNGRKRVWIEQKQKICDYLVKSLHVNIAIKEAIDGENGWYPDSNHIILCSRQNFASRLHTLLHECGHVLCSIRNEIQGKRTKTLVGRTNILREEVLAWHYGKKLASKLNLVIDEELYAKHASKHVAQYVKYVLHPEDFETL